MIVLLSSDDKNLEFNTTVLRFGSNDLNKTFKLTANYDNLTKTVESNIKFELMGTNKNNYKLN